MAARDRAEDGFDLPPLGTEEGTAYGWFDRWQVGMTPDGKAITDFADWEARDLHQMMDKDYKARQIENVLTLPIVSAERTITPGKGDKGEKEFLDAFFEADHLQGGMRTHLDTVVDQTTSSVVYKRAYFEKVFRKGKGQFEGKIVYDDIAFRPQTTCRLVRDPINGRMRGFEQEPFYIGPNIRNAAKWPIQIPMARAYIHTHGVRRDPLNGSSELEIAYWAYKTKQKILLLWFQFLQSVSLPRVIVKAQDNETSLSVAKQIANMKSSGVLPVSMPGGPDSVQIESLDVSGKGAEQFLEAINWLDSIPAEAVLAGFLNLTGAANQSHFGGSYALSKDSSDFFLQAREADAREVETSVKAQIFAPIVYHNFGRDAVVPSFTFEPLHDIDKTNSINLLTAAMAAPPGGPIPVEFIAALAQQVSEYLGMDGGAMHQAFMESFTAAAEEAKIKAAQTPTGATPTGQAVAGMNGAVSAAAKAVKSGKAPGGPKVTAPGFDKPPPTPPETHAAIAAKTGANRKPAPGTPPPRPPRKVT